MQNLLAQSGKDWKPTLKQRPSKMLVVDMDALPQEWKYFMNHTLDINRCGFDPIAERTLEFYLFLTRQTVNIGRIISGDMDEIAQSPNKSLGNATLIPMLCQ